MQERKVKLYIAASLDGFIARPDGGLDWLEGLPNPNQDDYGYFAFYDSVDTVIMGRKTYSEILGFDVDWPYGTCKTFIISRNQALAIPTEKTELITETPFAQVAAMKKETGKDMWLVGGGLLITEFLNAGLIDEMILSVVPVVLGEGISLFPAKTKETQFELLGAEAFASGIVNLSYRKK